MDNKVSAERLALIAMLEGLRDRPMALSSFAISAIAEMALLALRSRQESPSEDARDVPYQTLVDFMEGYPVGSSTYEIARELMDRRSAAIQARGQK